MKLSVQELARQDILDQISWYAERGLSEVVARYSEAASVALTALSRSPEAGPPRLVTNPQLTVCGAGWCQVLIISECPNLLRDDLLIVLRVLHAKRDIDGILRVQGSVEPES